MNLASIVSPINFNSAKSAHFNISSSVKHLSQKKETPSDQNTKKNCTFNQLSVQQIQEKHMAPQQAHQQAAAIGDDALSRQHRTNTDGSLA